MESAVQLNSSLIFLAYTTGIIILMVGLMLTKVLFDISGLTKNVNEMVIIAKTEIKPTLENINKSVEILSGIVIKTDENIKKIKTFVSKTPFRLLGGFSKLTAKASKGFWSGLCTAIKMFSKK